MHSGQMEVFLTGSAMTKAPLIGRRRRKLAPKRQDLLLYLLYILLCVYIHIVFHCYLTVHDDGDVKIYQIQHPTLSRGHKTINIKKNIAALKTPPSDLSACLLVMDDNHFLIGK
jgi:hypothetical protein